MKILFLIPSGTHIACGAVRVLQYLPYFDKMGVSYDVLDYEHRVSIEVSKFEESLSCRNKHLKALMLFLLRGVRGYFNRFYGYYVIKRVKDAAGAYDYVFSQRVLLSKAVIDGIKKTGCKFIFDFDDSIFLECPDTVRSLAEGASLVVTGSHFTHEYALSHNPNAILVPSSVPLEKYCLEGKDRAASTITIGWIGSSFTLHYLAIVSLALQELVNEGYDFQLLLAGTWGSDKHLELAKGIKLVEIPHYYADDIPRIVEQIDIGIMPLHNTQWEMGKCAMKALLYMAGAKPVVSSPVGEVLHIIEDGVNGFLAETAADWKNKIKALIDAPESRYEIGKRGRRTIEERYSTEKSFTTLYSEMEKIRRDSYI